MRKVTSKVYNLVDSVTVITPMFHPGVRESPSTNIVIVSPEAPEKVLNANQD